VPLLCRIDTLDGLEYFRHGGILHYLLRHLMKAARVRRALEHSPLSKARSYVLLN